jgi:hypothetical protein
MSNPMVLVLCAALSTAFKPFTPVAPPELELIKSQPRPNGWQLTVGGLTAAAAFGSIGGRGRFGSGIVLGLSGGIADPLNRLLRVGSRARGSVDGEKNGPESKEQPFAVQPVAAGPTKVGENSPKVEDVTAPLAALAGLVAGAAAAASATEKLTTIISKTAVENRIDRCFPLSLVIIGFLLSKSKNSRSLWSTGTKAGRKSSRM